MAKNRNAPCPCGSGKKYKTCCMQADEALHRASRLGWAGRGEEPWHPEARRARVWEADVVPLSAGLADDQDAAPAMVMVVAAGFVVAGDTLGRRPAGAAARARVVAEAVRQGARVLGVLPERLHVRDPELAEALREELAGRDLTVEAAPLPQLDPALDEAMEHLCGAGAARATSPVTWAETGATAAAIADYHAAAAEFFRAAPWEQLSDEDLLRIELTDGSTWTASVMGNAGVEFGIAFYSEEEDIAALLDDERPSAALLTRMVGRALTTSFDPRAERPHPMQREVAAAGWEVASPAAYPILIGLNLPERRLTAEHLRTSATVLRAVARLARGEAPDPSEVRAVYPVAFPAAPWPIPERPEPICAEGEGADPAVALRGLADPEPIAQLEEARRERMLPWLEEGASSRAARAADLRNAAVWTDFLGYHGLAAGAVTEYDLRLFLYDYYPRRGAAPKTAARALPRSLRRIVAFLAEEGIRYPFAERVLAELDELAGMARGAGERLEVALDDLSAVVYDDLEARQMLHDRDIPGTAGGWPALMNLDVAELEHELQRRWLLWYDEAARRGVRDHDDLRAELLSRQRAWEATPHPEFGGRTPAEVVGAYRPPFAGHPGR